MTNQEKLQVLLKKPENMSLLSTSTSSSSSSIQLMKNQLISPKTSVTSIEHDKSKINPLQKLNKQVADIKKKQLIDTLLTSPGRKLEKSDLYTDSNSKISSNKLNNIQTPSINRDKSVSSTFSETMLSKEKIFVGTKRNINELNSNSNQYNFSSSPSSNSHNIIINPVKRRKYLSKEELLMSDTQIIDSSSLSSSPPSKLSLKFLKENDQSRDIIQLNPFSQTIVNSTTDVANITYDDKKQDCDAQNNSFNISFNNRLYGSSPIKNLNKQRKQVAFSSDIESSPITSSPIKINSEPRSILKLTSSNINNQTISIDHIIKKDLSLNESWLPGLVIQIPAGFQNLSNFVSNCVSGLHNKQFKRQYEVFATLNDLLKKYPKIISNKNIFTREVNRTIISSIHNEVQQLDSELKNGSNAFKLRISSQGIKLLSSIIPVTSLLKNISLIYDNLIQVLKNDNISKNLVASIFQLFKVLPELFYDKIDSIISSITQMKYFLSATVTCEKLNILKRFILIKPAVANKSNYQVLSHVFYSIINTDVPAYSRILSSAISVLTVLAKNEESKIVITKLLSEEIEDSYTTIRSTNEIQIKPSMTICQAICETLRYSIHLELYQQTTRIWTYIIYMASFHRNNFLIEDWPNFHDLLHVFKELSSHKETLFLCLEAWKSIVYNFQIVPVKSLSNEQLTKKLDLLLLPFDNLIINNAEGNFKQWTHNEKFVLLYCRIFYAIRLHMENANESQIPILLEYALKPLAQLDELDSIYSFIMRMIFISDRHTYCETAESCFWLSDYEKWISRISSLPKTIFKSSSTFDANLKITRKIMNKSSDIILLYLNTCIYKQLEDLKLAIPFKEYCKIANMCTELIVEIFRNNLKLIQTKNSNNFIQLYKFIENANEDLMFFVGNTPLMRRLLDILADCENVFIIDNFLSLCVSKFNRTKIFISCYTSDIYDMKYLLENDSKFPPVIHYSIDMKKIESELNLKLTHQDLEKIIDNLIKSIDCYLVEDVENRFVNIISFLNESNIFKIIDAELKLKLFYGLLDKYVKVFNDMSYLYEKTSVEIFKYSLERFDNMETDNSDFSLDNGMKMIEYLSKFNRIDKLPDSWVLEIGERFKYIIYPGINYNKSIIDLIENIKDRLPDKIIIKAKKLAIKRKVDGIFGIKIKNDDDHLENNNQESSFLNQEKEETNGDSETKMIEPGYNLEKSGESVSDIATLNSTNEKDGTEPTHSLDTQIIDNSFKQTNSYSEENENENGTNYNIPIKVQDLKSFIIDSIHIEGSIDENTVRVPSKLEKIHFDEELSPAKRTRSHTKTAGSQDDRSTTSTDLEDESLKKNKHSKKKNKKNKNKNRNTKKHNKRNLSEELEKAGNEEEEEVRKHEDKLIADMGQFRKLLKKINEVPIKVNKEEKEELETELVSLLMKLKKG